LEVCLQKLIMFVTNKVELVVNEYPHPDVYIYIYIKNMEKTIHIFYYHVSRGCFNSLLQFCPLFFIYSFIFFDLSTKNLGNIGHTVMNKE